jgi:hypothetical protein
VESTLPQSRTPYRDLRTSQWRKHGVAVFCL